MIHFFVFDDIYYYFILPCFIFWIFFSLPYYSPVEWLLDHYINNGVEILGWCFFYFWGLYIVICSISFSRLIDTSETYQLMFPFLFFFFIIVVEIITYFWWQFLEYYIKKNPNDEFSLFVLPWKQYFDYQETPEAEIVAEEDANWFCNTDLYMGSIIKSLFVLFFCIIFYFCTTSIFGTGYGFVPYYW